MSEINGKGTFKIADLVNKLEPFRLEYDEFVLEGRWWKYKTTTPSYAKRLLDSLPQIPESGTDEERQAAEKARNEAVGDQAARILTDTIESWNAVDEQDQPLAISVDTFNQMPEPFIEYFMGFFKNLRDAAGSEKKSQTSPSTS